jgi:hypothetical protein
MSDMRNLGQSGSELFLSRSDAVKGRFQCGGGPGTARPPASLKILMGISP